MLRDTKLGHNKRYLCRYKRRDMKISDLNKTFFETGQSKMNFHCSKLWFEA